MALQTVKELQSYTRELTLQFDGQSSDGGTMDLLGNTLSIDYPRRCIHASLITIVG